VASSLRASGSFAAHSGPRHLHCADAAWIEDRAVPNSHRRRGIEVEQRGQHGQIPAHSAVGGRLATAPASRAGGPAIYRADRAITMTSDGHNPAKGCSAWLRVSQPSARGITAKQHGNRTQQINRPEAAAVAVAVEDRRSSKRRCGSSIASMSGNNAGGACGVGGGGSGFHVRADQKQPLNDLMRASSDDFVGCSEDRFGTIPRLPSP